VCTTTRGSLIRSAIELVKSQDVVSQGCDTRAPSRTGTSAR
jgi:hypothetical protein